VRADLLDPNVDTSLPLRDTTLGTPVPSLESQPANSDLAKADDFRMPAKDTSVASASSRADLAAPAPTPSATTANPTKPTKIYSESPNLFELSDQATKKSLEITDKAAKDSIDFNYAAAKSEIEFSQDVAKASVGFADRAAKSTLSVPGKILKSLF